MNRSTVRQSYISVTRRGANGVVRTEAEVTTVRSDGAQFPDDVVPSDDSVVRDNAVVGDHAGVHDDAVVDGDGVVRGDAVVDDDGVTEDVMTEESNLRDDHFDPASCCDRQERAMIALLHDYLRPAIAPECLIRRLNETLDRCCCDVEEHRSRQVRGMSESSER